MTLIGPALEEPADVSGVISRRAAAVPEQLAVVSLAGAMTWSELDAAADRWAGAIGDLGLRRGDRFASLMPNRVALLVHYLGCLRAGVVAVPLNYRYVGPQIDHALSVSGASALFAHSERREQIRAAGFTGRLPLGCVWYGEGEGDGPTYNTLMERARPVTGSRPGGSEDDPAFIFFTSGSTGPSKGVTHTQTTFGFMVATEAAAFEMTLDDVCLPASSMSHMGALLCSMGSLAVGARVVVSHTYEGDELLPLIRRHRPTVLAMIPAALTALVRDHGATAADFATVRLCRAGADHVPAELESEFVALAGFPIDEGYGMTEVGLATLNPPSGVIKPGSIGTVVPGVTISLRDDDGREARVGEVGEIWMKSAGATVGYWQDTEASGKLIQDGWVESGDLARRDADGYLWFFGRSKQIIVHDGSNISPYEVEDALSQHAAVAAVGVVGVDDSIHGEDVRAYVTLVEGAERPSSQELIRFARDRVGYRAPDEVVMLAELPLNPTGKVDRNRLKAMAEDHRNPERR
jgi:acyl-CoA synthetase (AMP-forming)/AMP-acid ligase II